MIIIYNANYKTLKDTETDETVSLSYLESRLIEALSHGNFSTWNELYNYIYKDGKRIDPQHSTNNIKTRLLDKMYVNIVTKRGIGLEIRDEILLDYI